MKKLGIIYLMDLVDHDRGSEFSTKKLFSILEDKLNIFFINNPSTNYINKQIKVILKKNKIDFIMGHNKSIPLVVKLSKKYGLKSVVFVRDPSFLETPRYKPFYVKIIKRLFLFPSFKHSLSKADLVIANSKFMKKLLEEKAMVSSKVIYPIVDIKKDFAKEISGRGIKNIGMVIPTKNKGIEIFLKIAKRLPNKKFIVVGGFWDSSLKNVKYLGYQKNMKNFYNQIDLLLVPSLWNEAFGRVVVEAQNKGIPVIASKRGGLPEVVGNSLISDPYNIRLWIEEIKSYEDNKKYSLVRKIGYNRNKIFDPIVQSNSFYELLLEKLSIRKRKGEIKR